MIHHLFIGRWSPFHNGHVAMILTQPEPYLILVRATDYDPWPPEVRADMVKGWLTDNGLDGTVAIIPDIKGVYYGRGVGYEIEEVVIDNPASGTDIRNLMEAKDNKWQELVPPATTRVIQDLKVF